VNPLEGLLNGRGFYGYLLDLGTGLPVGNLCSTRI
jgi:hypothetical protein